MSKPKKGSGPLRSENSKLFTSVMRDKEIWGKSWKYRQYYTSWISSSSLSKANVTATTLVPKATEVDNPRKDVRNVQHLMCPKDITLKDVRHVYFRRNMFQNYMGVAKPLGGLEDRKYPYFNFLMYEPIVEAQFYFRWYAFSALMTHRAFSILPPQAALSLTDAAVEASLVPSETKLHTVL
nr:MAG TPA: hypothetical protein [Caudoviricetes sp.]